MGRGRNKWVIEGPENGGGGGIQNNYTEMTLAKRRDTSFHWGIGERKTFGVKTLFCVIVF